MAGLFPNCRSFWGAQPESSCGFEIILAHTRAEPFLLLVNAKFQELLSGYSNVWEG